jgi:hypothetical protein
VTDPAGSHSPVTDLIQKVVQLIIVDAGYTTFMFVRSLSFAQHFRHLSHSDAASGDLR